MKEQNAAMKINKGEYGYRDSHKRVRVSSDRTFGSSHFWHSFLPVPLQTIRQPKIFFTVMAILTVLPMANMASPLIASWKYRTPSEAFHQRMVPYEKNGGGAL